MSSGPAPAVAAVRVAVRRLLARERPVGVLVACSGGADSVALAAAVAFEAPRLGIPAGLVTVDHGLQDGSARWAAEVAALGRSLGLDPVGVRTVDVGRTGGPEAAARTARYTALDAALDALGVPAGHGEGGTGAPAPTSAGLAGPDGAPAPGGSGWALLLGHTLDDQAETVLLGLGRGSGPRSVAGMRPVDGRRLRPLLGIRRATTRQACADQRLPYRDDPHNADPRFTRVRLRTEVLPLLEDVLQQGAAEALARTADLLRADLDALDALAAGVAAAVLHPPPTAPRAEPAAGRPALAAGVAAEVTPAGAVDAVALAAHPAAIRSRVLRGWLAAEGVPPTTAAQLRAVDALVAGWHGQGPVSLPSGVAVRRSSGMLRLVRSES